MVSLKIVVALFFAHIINCGFLVWLVSVAQENGFFFLPLKIIVVYNGFLFVCFGVLIVLLVVMNARRDGGVLIVDTLSTEQNNNNQLQNISLDIEEEQQQKI
jgi:hypothetical protein